MKNSTDTTKGQKPAAASNGNTRSSARKDEMRQLASQAAANAPGIEDRINQARNLMQSHPLRAEQGPSTSAPAEARHTTMPSVPSMSAALSETPTIQKSQTGEVPYHVATPRGKYELVPLSEILENPFNARKTYREARIKEMKASIAANGQETPGTATIRDGKYVLAAGHYRFKALQQLDAPFMGLMVVPNLSNKALYEISYRENAEREDQSAFDNALAWRELLDTGVYGSEQELANAVGMSPANVNKTLGVLRLSAGVRELIAEDPSQYALTVLYELALFEAVGGVERTVALAKQVVEGEIGRRQINDARVQLEQPKARKERETSRQYKLNVGEGGVGVLKEWPNGKVSFEVNIADPRARAQFVEMLRKQYEVQE